VAIATSRSACAKRVTESSTSRTFAHLAAAFADQSHDDRVEGFGGRQHRKQRRLADAGAREDAEPLPEADGREDVDDAHAGKEGRADTLAGERLRRGRRWSRRGLDQERPTVHSAAERIDRAASPGLVGADRERAAVEHGVPDAGIGTAFVRCDQHLLRPDLHDLAASHAMMPAMLDHVAEPGRG
jgi:hypothetical protein